MKSKKPTTQVLHFSQHEKREEYEKGFGIDELFPLNTDGIAAHNESITSIAFVRKKSKVGFQYEIISRLLTDVVSISPETAEDLIIFPLYCYPETNTRKTVAHHSSALGSGSRNFDGLEKARVPNLNPEIIQKIAKNLGLSFIPEKEPEGKVCYINNPEVRDDFKTTFTPMDVLDYIYAALHSPSYKESYEEFLKTNFPRIPFPKVGTFWQLVKLGSELRQIHLSEGQAAGNLITQLKNIDKIGIE